MESNVATLTTATPASLGEIRTMLMAPAMMNQLEKLADRMASGNVTVPEHLRGNSGDCFAIVMQSVQWGMNPYAVAQKTYLVGGKLGYEAQLVVAVIETSGATKDRLHYEWFGDWAKILGKVVVRKIEKSGRNGPYTVEVKAAGWKSEDETGLGVRVWATLQGEDAPRELELFLTQAHTRNSTLWAEDPRQQLAYLAAKRWSRLYTPDVILGVYTPDELEEAREIDITPPPAPPAGDTQTERVADKLARRRGKAPEASTVVVNGEASVVEPAQPGEGVDALVAAIADAPTMTDLVAVGDRISAFLKANGNEHRKMLGQRYTARAAELTPPTPAAEPEQQPQQDATPALTFAEVSDRIYKAKTQDERDLALDLARSLTEEQFLEIAQIHSTLSRSEQEASA